MNIEDLEPTEVYDSYWKFATERQNVFFRRIEGDSPPWTDDEVIANHRFTNVYRASDRVSQYLIRNVIYNGDQAPNELFFRIMLFKLFNKIDTWELFNKRIGHISPRLFSFMAYTLLLDGVMAKGDRIYSAAYIMPSPTAYGYKRKHANHLKLLQSMMRDGLPDKITRVPSMEAVFNLLKSYPGIGEFLAYQFATDINYSPLTDFHEMDFVVAGPGAIDGIHKCFGNVPKDQYSGIIKLVASRQKEEFESRGLEFRRIGNRPLQLIDCQNLFCEISKYARVKHPDVKGINDRKKIKQKFTASKKPLDLFFPPDWNIDIKVTQPAANDITKDTW